MFNWRLFEKLSKPLWMLFFAGVVFSESWWFCAILKGQIFPFETNTYTTGYVLRTLGMCSVIFIRKWAWQQKQNINSAMVLSRDSKTRSPVASCNSLHYLKSLQPQRSLMYSEGTPSPITTGWRITPLLPFFFFILNIYSLWYLCPCCFRAPLVTSLCLQWS